MTEKKIMLQKYSHALREMDLVSSYGRVSQVIGSAVESEGPSVNIGELCHIYDKKGDKFISAEVVGFRGEKVLLMPLGSLSGLGSGSCVAAISRGLTVPVGIELKGRILDGLGYPMDGKGNLTCSKRFMIDNAPPNPLTRQRIDCVIPMGVRVIDGLLTVGRGQRIGIFAGSGVGKSMLMGMIARNVLADINVITLVGERGREVNDFIEYDLKKEGLGRSIIVVATSDQPALVRVKAAMLGTAIAEYFREMGMNVVLLMDSITRFAMAQREIGLAIGEPPVARGYTPSVFSVLPKLLERSGNSDKGSITGLYTVLVDGDDMNEPIADAVRGILDGHIELSRQIANRNHYPAVDVLSSISRSMPNVVDNEHLGMSNKIKNILSVYNEAKDLLQVGAYKKGTSPEIDKALQMIDGINSFLRQGTDEYSDLSDTLQKMKMILTQGDLV